MWRARPCGLVGKCLSRRFFQSSSTPFQRTSFWSDRIRTVEDLNLRLSTCLFYNQSQPAEKLFTIARKERLPFNQTSIEYTILALCSQDFAEKAEELLDTIHQSELIPVSERMFFSLIIHWANRNEWKRVNDLFEKMKEYGISPSEKTYGLLAYQVVQKENDRYREEFGFVSEGEKLEKKLQSTTKDADFFHYIEAALNRPSQKYQLPHMQIQQLIKGLEIPSENRLAFLHFLFRSEFPYTQQGARAFPLLEEFRRKYSQSILEPKIFSSRTPSFSFQGEEDYREHHGYDQNADLREPDDEENDFEELEEADDGIDIEDHPLYYESDEVEWPQLALSAQNILAGVPSARRPFEEIEYEQLFDIEKLISEGKGLLVSLEEDYPVTFGQVGGVSPSLHAGVQLNTVLGILTANGVKPNEKLFAALVLGYGRGGDIDGVQRIVDEFSRLGVSVDDRVLNCLIEVYARSAKMNDASHLDWIRKQKKIPLHHDGHIALIYGFGQVGKLDLALKSFEELEAAGFSHSHESYCALLYAYCKNGKFDEIPQVLENLQKLGSPAELYEYKYIISHALQFAREDIALSYFLQISKDGLELDQELLEQLFDISYSRNVQIYNQIFEKLRASNYHFSLAQYKAHLKLLLNQNQFDEAVELVSEMTNDYTNPTAEIFALIIEKLVEKKDYPAIYAFVNRQPKINTAYDGMVLAFADIATSANKTIAQYLEAEGLQFNEYLWESIVYYYSKRNILDKVWDSLTDMNLSGFGGTPRLYGIAIYAFIKGANPDRATETLAQMKRNGISVSRVTDAVSMLMRPDIVEEVEEFCEKANSEVTSMRDLLFSL